MGQPPNAGADPRKMEDGGSHFTQHCYGNSILGYFEPPNNWNGHVAGSLRDKVPHNTSNLSYRNGHDEYLTVGSPNGRPEFGVVGPFLTAVIAVFGSRTFFNAVVSSNNGIDSDSNYNKAKPLLCYQLRCPFLGLTRLLRDCNGKSLPISLWNQSYLPLQCGSDDLSKESIFSLLVSLVDWLANFSDTSRATAAFTLATYDASNAILNVGAGEQRFLISACAGTDLQKPTMSLVAMIVITLLLATQLAGLVFLTVYAPRHPSKTESLDSWATLKDWARDWARCACCVCFGGRAFEDVG